MLMDTFTNTHLCLYTTYISRYIYMVHTYINREKGEWNDNA